MSHNVEKWRKLLSDFQDAYSQHGRAFFAFWAVTFAERRVAERDREPWAQPSALLGCVPLDEEGENGYAIVVLRPGEGSSPAAKEERRLIAKGVPIDVASEAAFKRFRELAALAGAALPRSIRDSIPVTPPDALSWWLATLWWSNPPLQEEVSKKEQCLRLVSHDPFQDSIRLIEDLSLSTDSPKWPVAVTTNNGLNVFGTASPKAESLSGQLNAVARAVLLAMWRNGINNAIEKKTGMDIAKLPKAGLKYNTPMKEALVLLQQVPYQFVECPGRGYFLTRRGCDAGEQLDSKATANQKSGQSRR